MKQRDSHGSSEPRDLYVGSVFTSVLSSSQIIGAISSIILQIFVIALLIVVIQVDIFVDNWADPGSSIHLIYITFLTVLATLITTITTGQIRKLWFERSIRYSHGNGSYAQNQTRARTSLASCILVLTGLGGLSDQVRGWKVSICFIVTGLVTTAIVGGLTPRSVIYKTNSLSANIYPYLDGSCFVDTATNPSIAGQWFGWTLPNGSSLSLAQNSSFYSMSCGPALAKSIMLVSVEESRPAMTSYMIGGVEVAQNAAGVPYSITHGFDDTFGTSVNPKFLWSTRCLPVLSRNPVRCSTTGSVSQNVETAQLSVSSGDCSIYSKYLQVRPIQDTAAVSGACTKNMTIGTATIVIGAVNGEIDIDSGYANFLAEVMDDTGGRGAGAGYAVTCDVDLTQAVGFRLLNYSRSDNLGQKAQGIWGISTDSSFGYRIEAIPDSECAMVELEGKTVTLADVLTDGALAAGAGATWPLLAENMRYDGWFDSLFYTALHLARLNSTGGFAFNDSRHELEDALGLATAITMSLYWGGEGSESEIPLELAAGIHAYSRVRLGPASYVGLIYIIPPMFAAVVLTCLVLVSYRESRREESLPLMALPSQ